MTRELENQTRACAAVCERFEAGRLSLDEVHGASQEYERQRQRLLGQLHRAYDAATTFVGGRP